MEQRFGAFGKMPSLGDFFRLDTPNGFVRVWDTWLQSAMMIAAEAGGDAWDDQYMSAPIWRFTLSPGLAGAQKVTGVLMPSVDRVGRRFPLALMAVVPNEGPAALDHLTQTAMFEKLEDVALSVLEDGVDRDHLAASLADVILPETRHSPPLRRSGTALVLSHSEQKCIAPELASGLMETTGMSAPSLWSTILEDSSRAMVCDGLPDSRQACALFDLNAPLWGDARPQT